MREERLYGLDLLRLLAMFLVTAAHLNGSVLPAEDDGSGFYALSWLLECTAFCSVDCYALLSGYAGYRSRPKPSRAVSLWLQTAFYTVGATAGLALFSTAGAGREQWLDALLPVTTCQYWYVTAYFGLLLLMPVLGPGIERADSGFLKLSLAAGLAVFSVLPCLLRRDPYGFSQGYSFAWLVLLYAAGGAMRRFRAAERVSGKQMTFLFCLCILSAWGLKMAGDGRLIDHTSPAVLGAGAALTLLSAKLELPPRVQRAVAFLSPAALGVYLIHMNPLIYRYFIDGLCRSFPERGGAGALLVVLTAGAVWAVCLAVELVRLRLFAAVGIPRLLNRLDAWAEEHVR